jgi:cyclic pyranopterin phosphate synthase
MSVIDTLNRPLHDLRISVTDRCNFRCTYCMPRGVFGRDYQFLPHEELLTFEEITRAARIFADLGIRKIRLTGGEPLMRRELETLVSMLATVPNVDDIAMTTNGSFPVSHVQSLKDAGLKRISVSLDSLDDAVFKKMNDADFPVASVLEWIEASEKAGLGPVKVNMVVRRGVNEQSILPMARYFREHGQIVRFIEYMDVGHSNGWRLDEVVSAKEIRDIIHAEMPIRPVKPNYRGEVANRYRYVDGSGEIGIIASVSQPFCGDCNRARISADGRLFTCLFAINGTDLRSMLRNGADDESIRNAITQVWQKRVDRYSELRSSQTSDLPKVEMSYIGG